MTERLRIISWNILACRGWRSGEAPDRNPGPPRPHVPRQIADLLRRYQPDVVALQECPAQPVVADIARELRMHHAWFAARWPGNAVWVGGFPGALLSRLPMLDIRDEVALHPALPEKTFARHWGSASIDSPIGCVRVHAYHCAVKQADQSNEALRAAEYQLVLQQTRRGEPTILIGDHNASPGESSLLQFAAQGFTDAHAAAGRGEGFTCPADTPRVRIDQCWLRSLRIRDCQVISPHDIQAPTADPDPYLLSDHLPLCVDLARQTTTP